MSSGRWAPPSACRTPAGWTRPSTTRWPSCGPSRPAAADDGTRGGADPDPVPGHDRRRHVHQDPRAGHDGRARAGGRPARILDHRSATPVLLRGTEWLRRRLAPDWSATSCCGPTARSRTGSRRRSDAIRRSLSPNRCAEVTRNRRPSAGVVWCEVMLGYDRLAAIVPSPEPTSPLRRFSGIGGKVRDDQPSRTGAHSMPRSRVLIIAGVVIVAAVAIGGFLVYDQVLRGDNVAALTLPSAAPAPPPRPGRPPRTRRATRRRPPRPLPRRASPAVDRPAMSPARGRSPAAARPGTASPNSWRNCRPSRMPSGELTRSAERSRSRRAARRRP